MESYGVFVFQFVTSASWLLDLGVGLKKRTNITCSLALDVIPYVETVLLLLLVLFGVIGGGNSGGHSVGVGDVKDDTVNNNKEDDDDDNF